MSVGISELLVIVILAVAVLKPEKLPVYAQKAKEVIVKLKSAKSDLQETMQPVHDVVQPINEIRDEVTTAVSDLTNFEDKNGGI